MQTQILKYKKIQKVITESGPSLPGLTPSPSPTDTDSESIMVVHYACMACQTGSGCSAHSYFTTYQQAASHYANRECSVQPVSLGHSHCHPGATQQAY